MGAVFAISVTRLQFTDGFVFSQRLRRFRRMGSKVQNQGPSHLRSCLPRSFREYNSSCTVCLRHYQTDLTFYYFPFRPQMNNMLIRPTAKELAEFGTPDFTIYNAGQFPANRFTAGMTSNTSVEINFKRREIVILGTEYAGEMKKGIFSVMHYLQPIKFGQLSLHSSANEGPDGDVSLFFGLSGTGKTWVHSHIDPLLATLIDKASLCIQHPLRRPSTKTHR